MAGGLCFRGLLSGTTAIDMLCRVRTRTHTHTNTHTHTHTTGPCFTLYIGIFKGFGNCGEVPADVEYGSDEFWQLLGAKTVADRMEKAGHKFSSTMHVLQSAIKKLQTISEGKLLGTRIYRGLGN
jgi:hypothetical protein